MSINNLNVDLFTFLLIMVIKKEGTNTMTFEELMEKTGFTKELLERHLELMRANPKYYKAHILVEIDIARIMNTGLDDVYKTLLKEAEKEIKRQNNT